MEDEQVLVRPPSEANSFLLPVTFGCSHNTCTFCGTYSKMRFRIRPLEDIKRDIDKVAKNYSWSLRRVFLENGDAIITPQRRLVEVLKYLNEKFPNLEKIGTYTTPQAALIKSVDELKELHELGLKIAYMGVESGDEGLLKKINKGATYGQIVEAGRKIKQAGITLSVTVILGLGGPEGSQNHALKTARILSDIDPDFAGALTILLVPGTPLHRDWEEGKFELITPFQSLAELKMIIENAKFTDCFFTANHASNYLPIKARLPRQKAAVLQLIDEVLTSKDMSRLRPEFTRAL
ncbi:MAG: radical SAM protein [Dehalococcoidales bacterium]|nr:radical SAM protein [Dehalococcoidales bacterium]